MKRVNTLVSVAIGALIGWFTQGYLAGNKHNAAYNDLFAQLRKSQQRLQERERHLEEASAAGDDIRRQLAEALVDNDELQQQLRAATARINELESQLAVAHSSETAEDDLTRIVGIGPKLSSVLHAAGIKTFVQLAASDVAELEQILRRADVSHLISPATWPEQAAAAAQRH